MSFRAYVENHYETACNMQRNIKSDIQIISMLSNGKYKQDLVLSWMREYGLTRGIGADNRKKIADSFWMFASKHTLLDPISTTDIRRNYIALYSALFHTLHRRWTSATSKLLWCLYPNSVVIYDSFVHRTLVVMQCLDSDLDGFLRIGNPPKVKEIADIKDDANHYINYQDMVNKLLSAHQELFDKLRKRCNETYLYDIRIIDKILWMIGNSRSTF